MYFKVSMRTNPETGIYCGYYRLVESYRNSCDRVCHRTILNAGYRHQQYPQQRCARDWCRMVVVPSHAPVADSPVFGSLGWNEDQVKLAQTHIISRAVYPASELETTRWIRENPAVCEVTGYDTGQITKDRLYAISKKLYAQKEAL